MALAFADDIIVIVETQEKIERLIYALERLEPELI